MSEPRLKFWLEVKGEAAVKMILDRQTELRLSGGNKKNLNIVTNTILNEVASKLKSNK